MPHPASYVIIENIEYNDNVKIYYDNKLLDFSIISNDKNILKINLIDERYCDKLIFYVDTDNEYTIRLYRDLGFKIPIMSKTIDNTKVSKPDITWNIEESGPLFLSTDKRIETSDLTIYLSEYTTCSYQEKYIYKYEVERQYYDDEYHFNVDGYSKDESDYRIYYKGEPITNTIEIIQEKIIEVPKVEYVYIENTEKDSSQPTECHPEVITETLTKINTEFIEKEVFKVPSQIYIIMIILFVTILLLFIKIHKKYVD